MSWWLDVERSRPHDFVVGEAQEKPYMLRWYIAPRNKIGNIYLHKFLRPDQDPQLHDHPWPFNFSYILEGSYVEELVHKGGVHTKTLYKPGDFKLRLGPAPHRIDEIPSGVCWTLFVTGPVVREWGFHCPTGWKHFKDFIKNGRGDGGGCG